VGLGNFTAPAARQNAWASFGPSLDKVATLRGHSNLNTTRIYTTPGLQDLENATNKLGDF